MILFVKVREANWDKFGTWASALCAVHCVLTGFALGLLSLVGLSFIGSPLTEALFIISAVGLGSLAVYHGNQKHHSIVPAVIFCTGMLFILSAHFVFHHESAGGAICSVLGGLTLISFHWVNLKLQRGCSCGSCNH
ncbi:MerC domain-containing protein [soil metagenome]